VQRSERPELTGDEQDPAFPRDARPRKLGDILDVRLRLGKVLGAGGMGTVYQAEDLASGQPVAVKVLHPFLAAGGGLTRFRREAEAAANLQHENIVTVREFGVASDGTAFIVMELLEGEDLRQLMRRGQLSVRATAGIVADATRGLAAAHRAGIVHRDLKPENIFVRGRDGTSARPAKILDFGIAKIRSTERDSTTATGVALGTPHYMAPEQARGERNIDHRVDLYALGVILYEALSGRKPHRGSSYNAILFNILHTAPEPLRRMRPDLPGSLCDVVERAMAYTPSDRFSSAEAIVASLTPFANGAADLGEAARLTFSSPAFGLAGSELTSPSTLTPPTNVPPRRRSPSLRWLVGAGLTALLALGLSPGLFGEKRPSSAPAASGGPATRQADLTPRTTETRFAPALRADARGSSSSPATTASDLPAAATEKGPPPPRSIRRPSRRRSPLERSAPEPRLERAAPTPVPDIDRVNPYHTAGHGLERP
jgi:eukaryotic-like serine/threonine-protein kinase